MRGVEFAHPGREPCLRGFDLHLDRGEGLVLEGPSGSGKTTVLRLATGLVPRVQGGTLAGTVELGGRPVHRLPARELPGRIGYVPQDPETALVARTVGDEVRGVLVATGTPRRHCRTAAEDVLERFGAGHLVERGTATLSGGESARVALAAAVAGDPDLLVLDEPGAQLDTSARTRLARHLDSLRREGHAILAAAHPPHPLDGLDRTRRLGDDPDPAPPAAGLPPPGAGEALVSLEGARHRYDGGGGVGPVDLAVAPGEVVALAGPNGSGKTTLLHLCAGLLQPQEGAVRVLGEAPGELPAPRLAQRIGVSFQHPAWHITQDTARDEVALTAKRLGRALDPDPVLDRLGLQALARTHPWDLSGGQRQRLAVATALAHQPPVLLLDEPTRGLDAAGTARFARLLAERCQAGLATVVATHHRRVQGLAHRVVALDRGHRVRERAGVPEVVA